MSALALGLWIFSGLLVLLVLRVHVGVAMLLAGGVCFLVMNQGDVQSLLYTLNNLTYARLSNYDLAVIPLFVLMGQFSTHGGLSRSLFRCASAFIGHWRGGLALSAIGACAGFGAICGSSLATAATMGQVALPELRRHRYSDRLATGAVAAGGTLGILIPPSVPLIIYAVLTQESIAKLFIAAVVPGVIAIIGYLLIISAIVNVDKDACAPAQKASWRERVLSFVQITPILMTFVVVIVGIYGGWANPTEAASIGAAACGLLAACKGNLGLEGLRKSLLGTAQSTGMIFLVLLGADLLNSGLALTQMPVDLAMWVLNSQLAPLLVLSVILLIYLALGCVMDALAMILLTIPIFYPMIMGLEFFGMSHEEKSIWFGILALMVVEIGLIHPPLGMNLFIVNKIARDVPYMETAKGVLPFLASDLLRIVLILLVPSVALCLLHL
ncbi:TRAP transporter large permease [Pseudomonas sp. LRF_L74]|uniref:TRAP transporter large permease n=1 Tax=Pseudomonas sp. LRF_L74 TaxID=3369422 RepID=UPI003F61384C